MKRSQLSFDYLFRYVCQQIPLLGSIIESYYEKHAWFQRFAKFGSSTLVIYWLLKAPLIWGLTLSLPSISLIFFVIPSYVIAAFLAGLILTLIGFVLNELWVWKRAPK